MVDAGELLDFIDRYWTEKGYAPSVREMVTDTGWNIATVHKQLTELRIAGKVTWEPRKPRTIRVTR